MSKLEVELEYLKSDQLSQVVELDRLCLDGLWSLANYQKELENDQSTTIVLSLVEPRNVIGIGSFWAILEEAHITLLAVHPDYQDQGLGKLIMYFLLKEAHGQKLERATLEVKVSNQKALGIYQKFGFKTAGIRKGYYQKTQEDALILWRSGLEEAEFEKQLDIWYQEISSRLGETNWRVKLESQID